MGVTLLTVVTWINSTRPAKHNAIAMLSAERINRAAKHRGDPNHELFRIVRRLQRGEWRGQAEGMWERYYFCGAGGGGGGGGGGGDIPADSAVTPENHHRSGRHTPAPVSSPSTSHKRTNMAASSRGFQFALDDTGVCSRTRTEEGRRCSSSDYSDCSDSNDGVGRGQGMGRGKDTELHAADAMAMVPYARHPGEREHGMEEAMAGMGYEEKRKRRG